MVVREKALDHQDRRKSRVIEVLHKVVGVADLYAWSYGSREFDEIPAVTVKKYITGDHLAEKDDVARALDQFVGHREYECDDESDAVAVGVAWLIENKMIDNPNEVKAK